MCALLHTHLPLNENPMVRDHKNTHVCPVCVCVYDVNETNLDCPERSTSTLITEVSVPLREREKERERERERERQREREAERERGRV